MPTAVTLPACLMDCYKVLYPNLDFSRVGFYSGLPSVSAFRVPDGFTMASGAASPISGCTSRTTSPAVRTPSWTSRTSSCTSSRSRACSAAAASRAPGPRTTRRTSSVARDVVDVRQRAGERGLRLRQRRRRPWRLRPRRQGPRLRGHALSARFPATAASEPWPIANPIGAQTYAEALQAAGSRQDREQRRADLVLPAQLAPSPDRRRLLDLRVQQPGGAIGAGGGHGRSAGFSEA